MTIRKIAARILRAALRDAALTERELADATAIDITLVRRYVRGEVCVGVKNAPKIAKALRLPLAVVLYGRA